MAGIKHLTRLIDLSVEEIMNLIQTADGYSKGQEVPQLTGKVIANLFFEPSTRTQYSFAMAEHKVGLHALDFTAETSSIQKGETLYDTVKTFEAIGVDAVVIRHPQNNYFDELIDNLNIPIFNGGDGSGNHPTQSLLDLLTIYQEFGKFEGLKIAIVGDIAHSRVAHTNIEVMNRLGMEVHVVAPEQFQELGYDWETLDEVIEEMDIIMLLRVQLLTHIVDDIVLSLTPSLHHDVHVEHEQRMKEDAIIMHPAPFNRGVEIADEVVECKRSRIFKQMENGVYTRMAVLTNSLS